MTLRILFRSFLPAALVMAAAAAPALAQSDVRMTVDIPFAFQAGGHLLPPGHYAVDKVLNVFLRFRPADAAKGNVASVLFTHDKTSRILDHAIVGFTCYPQQCYLRQVQQANSNEYLRVVPTTAEKRVQRESLIASSPRNVVILPQLALLESR